MKQKGMPRALSFRGRTENEFPKLPPAWCSCNGCIIYAPGRGKNGCPLTIRILPAVAGTAYKTGGRSKPRRRMAK
jgi:hypothetical protein